MSESKYFQPLLALYEKECPVPAGTKWQDGAKSPHDGAYRFVEGGEVDARNTGRWWGFYMGYRAAKESELPPFEDIRVADVIVEAV